MDSLAYTPLRMVARDYEDLDHIAAYLQDALIPLSGIEFDKTNGHFRLIVNRFCWESEPETQKNRPYYIRVIAGLSFQNVREVSSKGLNLNNTNELINLLTICALGEGLISLLFSGGPEIRLTVPEMLCHLHDIDAPYYTPNKPYHQAVER